MGVESTGGLIELIVGCRAYDLELPRFNGAPNHPLSPPGFVFVLHRHHEPGARDGRSSAAGAFFSPEHAGTHIDALNHQAVNMTLFGGVQVTPEMQTPFGLSALSTETIGPILTRGVLLDVASSRGVERVPERELINAGELQAVAAAQKTPIRAGDAVLVRTGSGAVWQDHERFEASAGIGADASQWLADLGVRLVGADNMAWDVTGAVDIETGISLPGHVIMLVRHGIYILEYLFLEELARDNVYQFAFVCLPLKIRGGTGSPVRPVALVSPS